MILHNEIFDRVKKTLGLLSGTPETAGAPIDFLVKMNLSAWMGRRDAAGDRIGELMYEDLFAQNEAERRLRYRQVGMLLDRAMEDTEMILMTLTSPDTETRERRQLNYWELLRQVISALEALNALTGKLFHAPADENCCLLIQPDANLSRDERQLGESEISLVNQFRELFESGRQQMLRYREYTAKSFSKSNAERYRKSYQEYHRLFRES